MSKTFVWLSTRKIGGSDFDTSIVPPDPLNHSRIFFKNNGRFYIAELTAQGGDVSKNGDIGGRFERVYPGDNDKIYANYLYGCNISIDDLEYFVKHGHPQNDTKYHLVLNNCHLFARGIITYLSEKHSLPRFVPPVFVPKYGLFGSVTDWKWLKLKSFDCFEFKSKFNPFSRFF